MAAARTCAEMADKQPSATIHSMMNGDSGSRQALINFN
jgi:hypothetical protein